MQGFWGSGVYLRSFQALTALMLHEKGWPLLRVYNQPTTLGEKHIKHLLKQQHASIHSANMIPNELNWACTSTLFVVESCFFPYYIMALQNNL